MLKGLLAQRARKQLRQAIEQQDLKRLNGLLDKLEAEVVIEPCLDGESPLTYALILEQTHALAELLKRGNFANHQDSSGQPLAWRALRQSENPLALLSALLSHGCDPNTRHQSRSLLDLAADRPDELAMVLMSRIIQQGLDLAEYEHLLINALKAGQQIRVKFLIESGIPWRDAHQPHAASEELAAFAKRIWQDKQLRDQWL